MIIYQNSRFTKTSDGDIVPGAPFTEEGFAAVYRHINGKNLLDLSTGAANEVFAGFNISRSVPPSRLPRVEELTAKNGVVTLSKLPLSDSIFVKLGDTPASAIKVGTSKPTTAGEVNLGENKLYLHDDDQAKQVYVQYHFEPTVSEAREITGDAPVGGDAAVDQNRVGLIVQAHPITLTNFDSSVSWDGVMHPSLGTNGLLTAGGSGTVLKNYIIKQAPSSGSPYLTIQSIA